MEPAEYIPSERGGQLLKLDGYLLSKNYTNRDRHHWKCRTTNCKVTAITEDNAVVKKKGDHIHPASQKSVLKVAIHNGKQDACAHPLKPMKRVFQDAFQGVDLENEEILDDLPSMKRYKSSLYRARSKRLPKIPHSRAEIILDGAWATTEDGRNFVLVNDGVADRLIIFGTPQNVRLLCQADTLYMDGTFKMAPEMFQQIYSIHVKVMGAMVPVAVALLPRKDEATYTRMFRLLKAAAQQFGHVLDPQNVCIDFEQAMLASVQAIFPNCRIRGCLFHFSQAVWRHVQSLGLSRRYIENPRFNRVVRRVFALPLVPINRVDDVWLEALNELDDPQEIRFCDYVTETWVDEVVARFPREIWNQYTNIGGDRTNNHLEGWHSALNRELGHPHPNIFALIEILRNEQHKMENLLQLLRAGDAPPQQRAVYRRVTERLVRLQQRLQAQDITVYHYAGAVGGILKAPNM